MSELGSDRAKFDDFKFNSFWGIAPSPTYEMMKSGLYNILCRLYRYHLQSDGVFFLGIGRMNFIHSLSIRGEGREVVQEIHGAGTWRQTWKGQAAPGDNWNDWLRTRIAGERLLAAYVPSGATGIDEMMGYSQTVWGHETDGANCG